MKKGRRAKSQKLIYFSCRTIGLPTFYWPYFERGNIPMLLPNSYLGNNKTYTVILYDKNKKGFKCGLQSTKNIMKTEIRVQGNKGSKLNLK